MADIKRGLVIEGGGARGAHTAGMLTALVKEGLPWFDVVCATSAGASTISFFVAKEYEKMTSVWNETFRDKKFLDLRRALIFKSAMDMDHLIDDVFVKRVPLNYQAIDDNPCDFFICATDCKTGQSHYFKNRQDSIPLALKASGAIPLAYTPPIIINGQRYVDGGISDSIPVKKAIQEGCQEIWVCLTQLVSYRKKPTGYFPWQLTPFRQYPHLLEAIKTRHIHYNTTLDFLHTPSNSVKIHIFAPQSPLPLERFTNDLSKIKQAYKQGLEDAIVCLTKEPGSLRIKS